jgi:hypothetical protein
MSVSDHTGPESGGRRHRRRRRPNRPEIDFPMCPVCQKAVRELSSAISHQETGQPAHFDCILKVLREKNSVTENEKICYLGKGSFGIVQFRHGSGPMKFLIRKRIQYEQAEPFPSWRKVSAPHSAPR